MWPRRRRRRKEATAGGGGVDGGKKTTGSDVIKRTATTKKTTVWQVLQNECIDGDDCGGYEVTFREIANSSRVRNCGGIWN